MENKKLKTYEVGHFPNVSPSKVTQKDGRTPKESVRAFCICSFDTFRDTYYVKNPKN